MIYIIVYTYTHTMKRKERPFRLSPPSERTIKRRKKLDIVITSNITRYEDLYDIIKDLNVNKWNEKVYIPKVKRFEFKQWYRLYIPKHEESPYNYVQLENMYNYGNKASQKVKIEELYMNRIKDINEMTLKSTKKRSAPTK